MILALPSAIYRKLSVLTASLVMATLTLQSNSAAAAVDYEHNFNSGKFSMTCSGNCPKVSSRYSRRGGYAMESTISNSSSNKKRTEAILPGKIGKMQFGRDYWIGFSIYLPAGWTVPNKMEILAQIHRTPDKGEAGGQPPVAIYSGSGEWKVTSQEWGGKQDWLLNSVYEDVGRWTDFVIHYRPSYTSNGILEVWKDGALVAKRSGANTAKDAIGPYFKMGIYKGTYSAPTKTVYHDELRIASGPYASYADVAPR
ncbi:polysaccharide lyase [Haliea sp. E17]|uniref:polysaccharide lyase n=1 Tax=Haliea sp. E17 TaxID=3401576 RepID=UPI003AAE4E95